MKNVLVSYSYGNSNSKVVGAVVAEGGDGGKDALVDGEERTTQIVVPSRCLSETCPAARMRLLRPFMHTCLDVPELAPVPASQLEVRGPCSAVLSVHLSNVCYLVMSSTLLEYACPLSSTYEPCSETPTWLAT